MYHIDEEDDDVDNTNMLDTFKMMLRDFIHKAELDFVKRQPQECASPIGSVRREGGFIQDDDVGEWWLF